MDSSTQNYTRGSFLCKRYIRSYDQQRAKYLTPSKIYGDNGKKTKNKERKKQQLKLSQKMKNYNKVNLLKTNSLCLDNLSCPVRILHCLQEIQMHNISHPGQRLKVADIFSATALRQDLKCRVLSKGGGTIVSTYFQVLSRACNHDAVHLGFLKAAYTSMLNSPNCVAGGCLLGYVLCCNCSSECQCFLRFFFFLFAVILCSLSVLIYCVFFFLHKNLLIV